MERIGYAASKMAKGNLWFYNLYVIGLAFLFSLLVFLVAGSAVFLALVIFGYVVVRVMPCQWGQPWQDIIRICMLVLTIVILLINFFAIFRNLKFRKE
jgi:hypothetical protein